MKRHNSKLFHLTWWFWGTLIGGGAGVAVYIWSHAGENGDDLLGGYVMIGAVIGFVLGLAATILLHLKYRQVSEYEWETWVVCQFVVFFIMLLTLGFAIVISPGNDGEQMALPIKTGRAVIDMIRPRYTEL